MNNVPAKLRSLPEIVKEFDEKWADIPNLENDYDAFHAQLDMRTTVAGTYVGRVVNYHPSLSKSAAQQTLLKSAWRHVYTGLNLDQIASAADRKKFEMSFETPPPFTLDNIAATFGDYVKDPRFHILKGLAECFSDLDPAFKSHSKIKVGVAGLPKRVVLASVGDIHGWGLERLKDTLNAIRVFEGKPHFTHGEVTGIINAAKVNQYEFEGMKLVRYKNGNAHLSFNAAKLRSINLALAEFYGDILPDVEPDKSDMKQRASTEVSKDLQFYATPEAVTNRILNSICIHEETTILEPSAGDGQIMDAIRKAEPRAILTGAEVHPGRAKQARQKGHSVMTVNFLETHPDPRFDFVIMNPPFYGLHWKKHLEHARKFLKPEDSARRTGILVCILPATAFYDGHLEAMGISERAWTDLPVASFSESGTNVPTGYVKIGPA